MLNPDIRVSFWQNIEQKEGFFGKIWVKASILGQNTHFLIIKLRNLIIFLVKSTKIVSLIILIRISINFFRQIGAKTASSSKTFGNSSDFWRKPLKWAFKLGANPDIRVLFLVTKTTPISGFNCIWYYTSIEAVRSGFSWSMMKAYVTSKMPHQSKIWLAYSLKNFKKLLISCVYY